MCLEVNLKRIVSAISGFWTENMWNLGMLGQDIIYDTLYTSIDLKSSKLLERYRSSSSNNAYALPTVRNPLKLPVKKPINEYSPFNVKALNNYLCQKI
jgi:hypothetical protein